MTTNNGTNVNGQNEKLTRTSRQKNTTNIGPSNQSVSRLIEIFKDGHLEAKEVFPTMQATNPHLHDDYNNTYSNNE